MENSESGFTVLIRCSFKMGNDSEPNWAIQLGDALLQGVNHTRPTSGFRAGALRAIIRRLSVKPDVCLTSLGRP